MLNKPAAILLSVVLSGSILAGCSDGTKLKEDAQNALNKQQEMKSYSFKGDADLNLGAPPAAKDSNPVTTGLLSIFQNSKLDWKGATSVEPLQFEADLNSKPAGSSTPLSIPLILKDNKLYLNISLINKKDEYFSVDMAQLGGKSGGLSPDSLKNATQSATSIAKMVVTDAKPKWFNKEEATLADGKKGKMIRIDVTEKNQKEFTSILQAKLPGMIDSLVKNGLISAGQADKMKQSAVNSLTVTAPGKVSFTTDDSGFIRQETVELKYSATGADGKSAEHHLNLHQEYNDINQPAKFQKEVPKQVRPFEDVLKMVQPQTPAASPTPKN